LNREARRRGLFHDRPEPDLRQWLDLAALGAICDVTQLVGFNRALAAQGLKVMSAWMNPGLAALMDVAEAKRGPATTFHAGFVLGPRINAGGRIGRADLGVRLLSTDDPGEAARLAVELNGLNAERKEVEREIVEAACRSVDRDSNLPSASVLVIAEDGWHPGVIGIVASRLRERYRKPVVVIGLDRAADIGKGSGRSQPGVNLGRAIQMAFEAGLLLSGGGHAMAAGLTLRPSAVPDLRDFLCETLSGEMEAATLEDGLDVDALISASAASPAMLAAFRTLEPFGPGNPEPRVALADVRCERAMVVRGGHVSCMMTDSSGGRLKAIAWRAEDTELGRRILAGGGGLHVAGLLKADEWNGRVGVQLEIEDAADPRRLTPL
jgi:single-stranded-DNA-specific exonuclease